MRIIERTWVDLSLGYQAVQAHQARLEAEFGRAVEVGQRRHFRRELNDWQKKRRIFFALVAIVPFTFIALCLAAWTMREVACVLAWWFVTALLAFLLMGVAGWNFIRQVLAGQPVPQRNRLAIGLADQWWNSLSPAQLATRDRADRLEVDFLTRLAEALPEDWLAVRDLFTLNPSGSGSDLLLVGPSGLWLFIVRHWHGTLARQDSAWLQAGRRHSKALDGPAPDDQWQQVGGLVAETIRSHLPHLDWASGLLKGGVVFSHPKARLLKSNIQGNIAPFGPAQAWMERLRQEPADERLTLEARLEILDALLNAAAAGKAGVEFRSARDQAARLYEQVASGLREQVGKMVK